MLVRFEDVHISFGPVDVLKGVHFQINPGDRIGLIGRNGTGKTTVLRLISGQLEPDRGLIRRSTAIHVGYMEQLVHADSRTTVLETAQSVFASLLSQEKEMEEISHRVAAGTEKSGQEQDLAQLSDVLHQFEMRGGYTFRARTERVLMGLGFSKGDFDKKCHEISGGQMNRLHLAQLLLSEPNILLLDEPTNHLDLDAVRWLEEFLEAYLQAFVVVSHDRYFLNRVVTHLFELEQGALSVFSGDYTSYVSEKQLRVERAVQAFESQQQQIEKAQDFIRRNIAGQKTKQAQSRRKMLARMERLERPVEEEDSAQFDFHVTLPSVHRVLEVKHGSAGYPGNSVVHGIEFKLYRGDRYGLIGKNGTGKSTLLKTLCGRIRPLEGYWSVGERVHIGYYDQTLENLNSDNTVLEELRLLASLATDGELRSYAARFLFRGEDVFQRIDSLSGGEKSRLTLAKLICERPNFLLLDEPTNHLDIASREALESALAEYDGTLLVASHDRYLLDRLVPRLLVFQDGMMEVFDGTYSEFERRAESGEDRGRLPQSPEISKGATDVKDKPPTLQDVPLEESLPKPPRRTHTNRERQRVDQLERVEDEITKLEAELREVEAHLSDSEKYSDPAQVTSLSQAFESVSGRLKTLYEQWEALQSQKG
ncbi:MAG: ABC-F family ATP-binding cassette domain-containing protein [Acidobacteriia bacterium]|nr:ABC-F family ATP-binding cassette domain-containing protein [Terriglobia bacterium]